MYVLVAGGAGEVGVFKHTFEIVPQFFPQL